MYAEQKHKLLRVNQVSSINWVGKRFCLGSLRVIDF
jgi:hypothetical protein